MLLKTPLMVLYAVVALGVTAVFGVEEELPPPQAAKPATKMLAIKNRAKVFILGTARIPCVQRMQVIRDLCLLACLLACLEI